MSEALKSIKAFKQKTLEDLYNQCKPKQQEFFHRMYKSIKNFPEDKIDCAIQQCERTIAKNEEQPQ